MPLRLISADLVTMPVGAVVNAANSRLAMGGGVCGAIFKAAGPEKLAAACRKIGHCPTGGAVATPGFDLGAKMIIHTVGPVWRGGDGGEPEQLRSCYLKSLALAAEHGLDSVAFPLISSGIFGYPRDQALTVAMEAIGDFLAERAVRGIRPAIEVSICLRGDVSDLVDPDLPPVPAKGVPYDSQGGSQEVSLDRLRRRLRDRGIDVAAAAANLAPERADELANGATPTAGEVMALSLSLGVGLADVPALLAEAGHALLPGDPVWELVARYLARGGSELGRVNRSLFALAGTTLP